jgi:hypothetical protein
LGKEMMKNFGGTLGYEKNVMKNLEVAWFEKTKGIFTASQSL